MLVLAWNLQLPLVQTASAAAHAGDILLAQLRKPEEYTFVDICAGAGGPTPTIEQRVNETLEASGKPAAKFLLTDLHPHVEQWQSLAKRRENISYISDPVDAADAKALTESGKKECRIFSLGFHHLDDVVAKGVLRSAIKDADAFVIFELQDRSLLSLVNVTVASLGASIISVFFFWQEPLHLLFTYLMPIVPFVLIFDGYVSSMRTRTPEEIMALMQVQKDLDLSSWDFGHSRKMILWPVGFLHYFAGVKT